MDPAEQTLQDNLLKNTGRSLDQWLDLARRKKQFCLLEPKTKTRLEIGLNMKGVPADGRLEPYGSNTMCSHKIRIEQASDIDAAVWSWIRQAYDLAG